MLHQRDDYNRTQDPENKIPKNEPVFLLRAQDKFAPDMLLQYADFCYENKLIAIGDQAAEWAKKWRAGSLKTVIKT